MGTQGDSWGLRGGLWGLKGTPGDSGGLQGTERGLMGTQGDSNKLTVIIFIEMHKINLNVFIIYHQVDNMYREYI